MSNCQNDVTFLPTDLGEEPKEKKTEACKKTRVCHVSPFFHRDLERKTWKEKSKRLVIPRQRCSDSAWRL